MKRALSLILSVLFVLGCVNLGAFSIETDAQAAAATLTPVSWAEAIDTGINGGYPRVITAGNGSLLMAYSAGTNIKIARSADGGKTWPSSAIKYAYKFADTGVSAGNPTPYFDVETKTIYLAFRAPSTSASPYTASIQYITSTDHGNTWSDPVTVVSSTVSNEAAYGGMWEPTIYRLGGKLRIFYSCDTVKQKNNQVTLNTGREGASYDTAFPFVESKAYQNIVMHTLDESTGLWSGATCSINGKSCDPYKNYSWGTHLSRPGMQSITQLNDGTYVMAVENSKYNFAGEFGDTRYPFVIDLYFSTDGVTWGNPRTVGISPKPEYYCAAPWVDTLPDGRIVVSYQTDEHRASPLPDNTNSHLYHQLKVIVSKNAVTNADKTTISSADFESYRPVDKFNTDLMYNAWNSVYVDGYKVHAIAKVSSSNTETEASKGICFATFDSAPDAATIPANYKPIYTADDMLRLMHQRDGFMWAGKYILMADIDMADATLDLPQQPIGLKNTSSNYFTGIFDGNDHSIKGIDIKSDSQWTGLFGYALNSTIKDLTVYGKIESTYSAATTREGGACGIVGHINGYSFVARVTNYVDITAVGTAGGLVGYAFRNGTTEGNITIKDCVNYGTVSSTTTSTVTSATGGIVGAANAEKFNIIIKTSVNYGLVSGQRYVGGILGSAGHNKDATCIIEIDRCVNEAPIITRSTDIGGIVGLAYYTKVTNCLNRGEVLNTRTTAGGKDSGGIVGRMHQLATLENCVNAAPVYANGGAICGTFTVPADTTLANKITNCYYSDIYATDVTTLGSKLSQGQAALPSSYAGLDFESLWTIADDGIIRLASTEKYKYSDASYTKLSTAEDILALMNEAGPFKGNYELTCDIDLSTYTGSLTQRPIGLEVGTAFKGVFEGNGYTISGIDIDYTGKAGFFGYLVGATVRNLKLEGKVTSTDAYTALMAGVANGTVTIDNCTVSGEVSGTESVGGFVGFVMLNASSMPNRLRIAGCTSNATITATGTKVGGIVGYVQHQATGATSVISGCINRGNITNSNAGQTYTGGICGLIRNSLASKNIYGDGAWIVGCSNFGEIKATAGQRIAGILPAVLDDKESECRVSNCANYGYIYAEGKGENTRTDVGGVVAVAINLNVDACVNYGRVEIGSGKICASVVGRLYNYADYAPAEIRNCYDLSGQGLEVVGNPDDMICDNYKFTYNKTFTTNLHLPEKYQGFETVLWSFSERGAYLSNSHGECTPIYKVTTEPSYTAGGAWQYWCPICGEIESVGTLEQLELVAGDVNGDGAFNNADITTLIRVLSKWKEDYLAVNADANADGKLNNRDAIYLAQKLAGWN